MRSYKLLITILSIIGFAAACTQSGNVSNNNSNTGANTGAAVNKPAGNTANTAAANTGVLNGKDVYALNCQKCHQESGKGGKVTVDGKELKVDDLTTDKMKARDDAKLAKQILEGAPDDGMPAFLGKLSNDELNAVIAHVRELQGK